MRTVVIASAAVAVLGSGLLTGCSSSSSPSGSPSSTSSAASGFDTQQSPATVLTSSLDGVRSVHVDATYVSSAASSTEQLSLVWTSSGALTSIAGTLHEGTTTRQIVYANGTLYRLMPDGWQAASASDASTFAADTDTRQVLANNPVSGGAFVGKETLSGQTAYHFNGTESGGQTLDFWVNGQGQLMKMVETVHGTVDSTEVFSGWNKQPSVTAPTPG